MSVAERLTYVSCGEAVLSCRAEAGQALTQLRQSVQVSLFTRRLPNGEPDAGSSMDSGNAAGALLELGNVAGDLDRVEIMFTEFISALRRRVACWRPRSSRTTRPTRSSWFERDRKSCASRGAPSRASAAWKLCPGVHSCSVSAASVYSGRAGRLWVFMRHASSPPRPPVKIGANASGKSNIRDAFRFLYERLLGAEVRPWLPGAFCGAAALPHIRPERRKELLQSISEAAATAPGWSMRAPRFFPEFVELEDAA